MVVKKDSEKVNEIIQILSLRKKQFVSVPKKLMPKLQDELHLNYPKAKLSFFGLGSANSYNVIRTSNADSFKKIIVN